jgi:hypothetical protein
MELIKRQISTRDIQGGSVNFKIVLTQKIDALGIGTDMMYADGAYSASELNQLLGQHHKDAGQIIGVTDSKLDKVKSYDAEEPYKVDLNIREETYKNYKGDWINGVDRVISVDGDEIKYTFGATSDINIGTSAQTSGILFVDNPKDGLNPNNAETNENMTTSIQYMGEGWNYRNTSISPQIQEEYLIGIISPPEVESDVFIDRGVVSVLDKHLRLSEIESLDHLERYGNGFYNINRD